jgi:hypothetical protein
MGYSFFLFTKLHDVILGVSEEPYDLQYDDMVDMYDVYNASEFNRSDYDEYRCMLNFLNDIKIKQS